MTQASLSQSAPLLTSRDALLTQIKNQASTVFDLAIIGGGATGLGIALEASLRGLKVVLLEAQDFAKGTSSRSSKLVHGGVRYLAQGNIALVQEALHERSFLLQNAPHLAQALPFIMPSYQCLSTPFYGVGLKVYDMLAGKRGLGSTQMASSSQTLKMASSLKSAGLKGGVVYWDGQFDDARLALALARTAQQNGALLLNYCAVENLQSQDTKSAALQSLKVKDQFTGQTFEVQAKCFVNATGVWVDDIRNMDANAQSSQGNQGGIAKTVEPMVQASQGIHLVVDRSFWPHDHALIVPKTSDGRVLFVIPWLGKTILGTTDTARADAPLEPRPLDSEVEFILHHAEIYLNNAPKAKDVLSSWVGLRPLVKPPSTADQATKSVSREHTIVKSDSGLVTVTGGKWTTYRAMADDTLAFISKHGLLPYTPLPKNGLSQNFALVGAQGNTVSTQKITQAQGPHIYGNEANFVAQLPGADIVLHEKINEAMVRFAVRYEYACTVEDVLARRFRFLFTDAQTAKQLAPQVAEILLQEGIQNPQTEAFIELCNTYLTLSQA